MQVDGVTGRSRDSTNQQQSWPANPVPEGEMQILYQKASSEGFNMLKEV
jgi:hypothetical protein